MVEQQFFDESLWFVREKRDHAGERQERPAGPSHDSVSPIVVHDRSVLHRQHPAATPRNRGSSELSNAMMPSCRPIRDIALGSVSPLPPGMSSIPSRRM